MNSIPKLVASRTLAEPLEWNARLISGDVAEEIAKLKLEPGKDIEMYGSASLLQTLMKHGLVDEYRVWVHPFVIGGGKRLFVEGGHPAKLRLASSKILSSGVVILTYEPPKLSDPNADLGQSVAHSHFCELDFSQPQS
ncbi:dihydrofolate reductase family protein [Mesorhizobium sp. Cs1299R1N3]|uniref:dihydrofolate reductase family protein n=1 Tax=Mesorhizobium sp. Cs1299R1N3 TaxID=3015173 RepID=UPI00301E0869